MISETDARLIQHRRGRYLAVLYAGNDPPDCVPYGDTVYRLTTDPTVASRGEARFSAASYLGESEGWESDQFSLVPAPVCACCGDWRVVRHASGFLSPYRCEKHRDRNPCVIEGCTKTRVAPAGWGGEPRLANNEVLCSEHWRRYVPPRSRRRRAYNAFFRRAKRYGWTPDLERKFWRFWNGLVKSARRQSTEGRLDPGEINRLFGWDQDEEG